MYAPILKNKIFGLLALSNCRLTLKKFANHFIGKLFSRKLYIGALLILFSNQLFAHGIGFQNTRVSIDPATIATLTNPARAVLGATPTDTVSFIMSVDTSSATTSGTIGYYTIYVPTGATVVNAEFVDAAFNMIPATAPSSMPDGWGPRAGPLTFTNWPSLGLTSTSNASLAVLMGDTGIFYSTNPITSLFNPNADGTITTNVAGATIKTTSQLMSITATHNMWDANQTRAFGAGTANAAANTPSTANVINTVGQGTTPFNAGSGVAGPDIGYKLDNTGAVGPWNRLSYPNSYSTLGVPSAAAPATAVGALAVVGVPTTSGAAFPLPMYDGTSGPNAIRFALGAPRVPATYYVRISFRFNAALLASFNGPIVNSEATGSDADGTNAGKDNTWRYHQPAATVTANSSLFVAKDIIAVDGVPTLNPATIQPGAKLTYRIRYMNAAGLPQTNIVLSDIIPPQISTTCPSITNVSGNASAVSNTCPAAGSTVTFNIPTRLNVAQGGQVTFDMQTAANANVALNNTVRITSTQNPAGATAVNPTTLLMPDLTVAKSHVGNFGQGQIGATYTLTASNVGNFNTTGLVTLTDTLPTGLTATAASGTGWTCAITAPANLITTCTRSDALAAGASYPPITLTVNVASNSTTPKVNSVSVSGGGEANTANNTATDSTIITTRPDLTITKTHTGNFFQGQLNAAYSITVTNIGGAATSGTFTVTDTLPVGLIFASATGTGCTFTTTGTAATGQSVTCTRTTALNAGANFVITLRVNVASNASTPLDNVAVVSGGNELNTLNNSATDSTVILKPPVVVKSFSPTAILANGTSLLTITLTNPNAVAMTLGAPAFTDVFPTSPVSGMKVASPLAQSNTCGGTLLDSAGGALGINDVGIRLNNGSIPANSSCTVSVNVTATSSGSHINSTGSVATVGSGTGTASTATLNVVVPVAPTIVKNFAPNPVENNFPTTLTISVTNPNLVPISAVTFNDVYPVPTPTVGGLVNTSTPAPGFTAASIAAGCTGTITGGVAGGGSIGLTGGVIPAGVTCDVRVQVVPPTIGIGNYDVTNTTTAVTTTNNGITATGLAATRVLNVITPSPPFIAKAFSPTSVGTSEISRLTFTITNPNSSRALAGIAFSDTYPGTLINAALPNVVSTCSNGTVTLGTNSISLTGADIPIAGSCTVAVNVLSASVGTFNNTSGTVTSTTVGVPTGNTASATLTVTPKPTISKSFSAASILAGTDATLTLVISNASTSPDLTDVAFSDTFPSNLLVATPNALTNTCGGTVSAVAASGVVSLSGGSMASGATCTITVAVTSNVLGSYSNTTSGVSSTQSGSAGTPSNTAILGVFVKPTISKSFSPTLIEAGSASALTFVITNPNSFALSGVAFTDNFPANVAVAAAPNASNSCGGTFAPAAGATSLSLSGGNVAASATCTLKVDVTGTVLGTYNNTASGVASTQTGGAGEASNTASLIIAPAGVPVSGFVYSDANHNILKDSSEAGTGLALFAKLVPSAGGSAIQAVTVDAITGAYIFPSVPVGNYSIVIDNNSILGDVTPTIPSTYTGTEIPNQIRSNIQVGTSAIPNLNFGLFFGNRLNGTVFIDNGIGGGIANNGVQEGGELGKAGVPLKLTNASGTIIASTSTDGSGNYSFWLPNALSGTVVNVVENNLSGYLSTGGNSLTAGPIYDRNSDKFSFTHSAGTNYIGLNFGDVPPNTLLNGGQQSALPGSTVYFAHTYTAGSAGSLLLEAESSVGWPQVLYRDTNCNGLVDAGEPVILSAINLAAGEKVCVIIKETIPNGVAANAQDSATLEADFTYSNAVPGLNAIVYNIDLIIVSSANGAGLVLLKSQDNPSPLPGTSIHYIITYTNNSSSPISQIVINDATPGFTNFVSAACVSPLPANITACSATTQPAAGSTGSIVWTLTGSLLPSKSGQVQFEVKVNQ